MSFIIRPVQYDDLGQLVDLAKQFNLLNLPGDKKVISEKIERSEESFAGKLPKHKTEYIFVVEDVEEKLVVGSSLVIAKHGTEEVPHSFFKIFKRDHFSQDLGIGFIHQVLRFQLDFDGPTEIGGLLVDKTYRRRPEKLGKQISLSRFLYMGLHREKFEDRVLCELTPPLTDEGRSEFWEALGRRFTGLPYQEADLLSQSHKEFIESLFPQDDIYLALLDAKARLVLGRVGEATKPAQHLLESIGFNYLDEVDPFDGGPHYGANTEDILPIKYGKRLKVTEFKDAAYKEQSLVAATGEEFKACLASADIRGQEIAIAPISRQLLGVEVGEEVYVAPFNYNRGK
ncbi:arginine N-succinyltransferase [Bdellovibrio bacteriovorus]|uniref:Arginine N-succinyltransferase n=1 Tax=Bdellovibrio bacteriovorus TaxID=959 RepID=A0A150WCC7_BDEBC|nr:arginine N-succinyltransferase [Bdellovibrio bacteriovorus]KYG60715.1 arginine N-succinyltransferase [Bdellovibrio bacteriovorus]